MKICHITSVHPRYDIRIYLKMCCTLALYGYNVSLIVGDGNNDEVKENIKIYGIKKQKNRFLRLIKSPKLLYKKALEVNANIYHLHDPELISIGVRLKKIGKIVIFDSHEDYQSQLLNKPYWNKYILNIISKIYRLYEKKCIEKYDAIITATPYIKEKISNRHPLVVDVNNFPMLDEFVNVKYLFSTNENILSVCYVGGLTENRGIKEIIKAMEYCSSNVKLKLAGEFTPLTLKKDVSIYEGWEKTEWLGFIDRSKIGELFSESFAGLVILKPIINYLDALPIKLFEYMSAGLPVIASNFPLWKKIVEENQCGICVDPSKPEEISSAIEWMMNNKEKAIEMGKNGKKAASEKYNWNIEKQKLLDVYKRVLS